MEGVGEGIVREGWLVVETVTWAEMASRAVRRRKQG
jgi:hypothetical protein